MKIVLPEWVKKLFSLKPAAILFGSWAVNCYAPDDYKRMTGDVDILTHYAEDIALLAAEVAGGKAVLAEGGWCVMLDGIKIADIMPPRNGIIPPSQIIEGIPVITKQALIAAKQESAINRAGTIKGDLDKIDLRVLTETESEDR